MTSSHDQFPERIQKLLATIGVASRREIESWIANRRLKVNGLIAVPGQKITFNDRVMLDDVLIPLPKKPHKKITQVLLYHKPVGEICSRVDDHHETVYDFLPPLKQDRWVSVGRLDVNTSGLLLFTNNGDLAARLMHPRHEVEREYRVRVLGDVTPEMMDALTKGFLLDGAIASFEAIKILTTNGANRWYQVILTEGRQREVRRLFAEVGATVSRLMRVRYGSVILPRDLPVRSWCYLNPDEIAQLTRCLK